MGVEAVAEFCGMEEEAHFEGLGADLMTVLLKVQLFGVICPINGENRTVGEAEWQRECTALESGI